MKCLSYSNSGTTLDKLYIVRNTDEDSTVLCYVQCPYGNKVRKLLENNSHVLPGVFYIRGLSIRKVNNFRRVDSLKGIEMIAARR